VKGFFPIFPVNEASVALLILLGPVQKQNISLKILTENLILERGKHHL